MNAKGKYVYEWPRPMVTVDAVVFAVTAEATKLLLIKRGNEPFKGQWAIPGGFIGMDEELEDAVARELQEETGLTGIALEQMPHLRHLWPGPLRQTNHRRLHGHYQRRTRPRKSRR